jgi:TIR domain-containing protein
MQEPFYFICYSSVDGQEIVLTLADRLAAGPPSIQVWLDRRSLQPGIDWDEQIVEALRGCAGVLYVMTKDSVSPNSECKREWTRALKYNKPIIPLLFDKDAELPFRLEPRQLRACGAHAVQNGSSVNSSSTRCATGTATRRQVHVSCASWFRIGSARMRFPQAEKIALVKAGATGGNPGSPTPPSGWS